MTKVQRKIKKKDKTVIHGVDSEQNIHQINIGDNQRVFQLRNVMPSGFFSFIGEDGKNYLIKGGNSFEMTENELRDAFESVALKEGSVIFLEECEEENEFVNAISDSTIDKYVKSGIAKFRKFIDKIDSDLAFDRISDRVLSLGASAAHLEYLRLRRQKLAKERFESKKYIPDGQRDSKALQETGF